MIGMNPHQLLQTADTVAAAQSGFKLLQQILIERELVQELPDMCLRRARHLSSRNAVAGAEPDMTLQVIAGVVEVQHLEIDAGQLGVGAGIIWMEPQGMLEMAGCRFGLPTRLGDLALRDADSGSIGH